MVYLKKQPEGLLIDIQKKIGKGYSKFWNFKGRYRVLKGGRGSKKSSTTSIYYIYMMLAYWYRHEQTINILVIRKHYRSIQESVFNQLLWAIDKLGLGSLFDTFKSPLKIVFKPSGGEILFRGLDDPLKITSIKPALGHLCWVWFEEAYEINSEEDFNKIDMSIRGLMPKELFYQITITMNPWSSSTWIKGRFFDRVNPKTGISEDGEILAITRNYDCNEWLDEQYLKIFEIMKRDNPRRYKVEGLGEWGATSGLIYENWEVMDFNPEKIYNYRVDGRQMYRRLYGLDFGFSLDPTAFVAVLANEKDREIFIYDEIYMKKMTNDKIAEELKSHISKNSKIVCDCAEPKSIEELYQLGINAVPAKKGRDSVIAGIQKLQDYKMYVHPRCKNVIMELENYSWALDKDGKEINKPKDEYNHALDALRYATEGISGLTIYF